MSRTRHFLCTRRLFACVVGPRPPLAAVCILAITSVATADAKKTIGWIERIVVSSDEVKMQAKVDTGADNSSVRAEQFRFFSRDGAQWIEFTLIGEGGSRHRLQRPLQRTTQIKLKGAGVQRRPVVKLQLCVGDDRREIEFNLAQRAHFKYPALLGRSFLKDHYLVDSGQKYLLQPRCSPSAK